MALERLNRWEVDAVEAGGNVAFHELRDKLSELLLLKGVRIKPKGILQNLSHYLVGVSIALVDHQGMISRDHYKYESTVIDAEGTAVPIKISTSRIRPHADDPKRAEIKVAVGRDGGAVSYYIGREFNQSSIVYASSRIYRSGDILPKEVGELYQLLEKLN